MIHTNRSVLFLDVDGVLNSRLYLMQRYFECEALGYPKETLFEYHASMFDPQAVSLLNQIVDRTGCEIVLSSSWRRGHTVEGFNALFRHVGSKRDVLGFTPKTNSTRWAEIQSYIATNQLRGPFCAIDDDCDLEGCPWWVKTEYQVGMTQDHVEMAVHYLHKPIDNIGLG